MVLTDTGPLVAIMDRDEPNHGRCVATLGELTEPLLTTWPVFTEAMYLLRTIGGWRTQAALWELTRTRKLQLAEMRGGMLERMEALMEKFRDQPMDLADASLVALAEEKEVRRIFTLDRHFRAYRVRGKKPFLILP